MKPYRFLPAVVEVSHCWNCALRGQVWLGRNCTLLCLWETFCRCYCLWLLSFHILGESIEKALRAVEGLFFFFFSVIQVWWWQHRAVFRLTSLELLSGSVWSIHHSSLLTCLLPRDRQVTPPHRLHAVTPGCRQRPRALFLVVCGGAV